jgi:hypothetical protein
MARPDLLQSIGNGGDGGTLIFGSSNGLGRRTREPLYLSRS